MAYPDPNVAARRNLLGRIQRFIEPIGKDGFQPNVDAIANLAVALDCLERAEYANGEDAMMLAEKGWGPRFPKETAARPIAELVAHLERLAEANGG